jgi:hypothetical protein
MIYTYELVGIYYGFVRFVESEILLVRFRLSLCALVVSPGLGSEPDGPGVPGIIAVSELLLTGVSWSSVLFDEFELQEVRLIIIKITKRALTKIFFISFLY